MTSRSRAIILADARHRDRQWLDARRRGIGASDMPKVLGISKWGGPLSVWEEKIQALRVRGSTGPQERGHALEPIILQMVADRKGVVVREDQKLRQHPDHTWMLATIDGVAADAIVVEAKTVNYEKDIPAEPPLDWVVQVNQQLEVMDWDVAYLAVLSVVDWCLVIFTIHRDRDLLDRIIIPRGAAFWQSVVDRVEPGLDGSEESLAAWRRLHGQDDGTTIELSQTVLDDVEQWERAKAEIRYHELIRQESVSHLSAIMGDHSYGWLPNGRTLTLKLEESGNRVLRCRKSRR